MYSIGAVARMLGSTPAVLRAWEGRYGVVIAARSRGDQRQYSRDHVDQLRYVLGLVESGLQVAEAHRLLGLRLRDGKPLVREPSEAMVEPVSILVAERDVYARALIEDLLRTEGYEVAVVADPRDALARYEEHRSGLVFVELVLSGGSGLELCRALDAVGARTVAVSALDLGAEALAAGAEAFLRKPLDPFDVLSTVEGLVGPSRSPASGPAGRR